MYREIAEIIRDAVYEKKRIMFMRHNSIGFKTSLKLYGYSQQLITVNSSFTTVMASVGRDCITVLRWMCTPLQCHMQYLYCTTHFVVDNCPQYWDTKWYRFEKCIRHYLIINILYVNLWFPTLRLPPSTEWKVGTARVTLLYNSLRLQMAIKISLYTRLLTNIKLIKFNLNNFN